MLVALLQIKTLFPAVPQLIDKQGTSKNFGVEILFHNSYATLLKMYINVHKYTLMKTPLNC